MRVSISEQRDTVWENMREEGEERDGPTERKDSFLMPAINFARRMSMKLTGSRGSYDHLFGRRLKSSQIGATFITTFFKVSQY